MARSGTPFANNGYDAVGLFYSSGRGKRLQQSNMNAIEQNETDYLIELIEAERAIVSRFRWEGEFFKEVPPQYLETNLFWFGRMIACRHPDTGVPLILRGAVSEWDIFYEPSKFSVWGNGFQHTYDISECVDIRENPTANAPAFEVGRQCFQIADMKRALQNMVNAMKKTLIIEVGNKQGESAKYIANAMLDNNPYLILRKNILGLQDKQDKNIVPLTTPADIGALTNLRLTEYNNMLSRHGINTNMHNKSQYRSELEISGDTSHVELILRQAEYCRQKAVDEVKKKLGFDISFVNVYQEAGEEAAKLGAVGNEQFNSDNKQKGDENDKATKS